MAKLVAPTGSVLGVEKVPELALRSVSSIRRCCPDIDALGIQLLEADDLCGPAPNPAPPNGDQATDVGVAVPQIDDPLEHPRTPSPRGSPTGCDGSPTEQGGLRERVGRGVDAVAWAERHRGDAHTVGEGLPEMVWQRSAGPIVRIIHGNALSGERVSATSET